MNIAFPNHTLANVRKIKESGRNYTPHSYLEIDLEGLRAIVTFCASYAGLNGLYHLEFYALTNGWEDFTGTGYRSRFFHSDVNFNDDDVIKTAFFELLDIEGFDIKKPVQASLF